MVKNDYFLVFFKKQKKYLKSQKKIEKTSEKSKENRKNI
jgi:hypothetical protein